MGFIDLTMICFSNVFADKRHVTPRLSLVNVQGLNKVLRSEIFISEDRQLQAVHLILNFEPLSNQFHDMSQAIRAGDPRLTSHVIGLYQVTSHGKEKKLCHNWSLPGGHVQRYLL